VTSRIGLAVAAVVGLMFLTVPGLLLGLFGMTEPLVTSLGRQLLRFLSLSGLFVTVALSYTGGLQGTGDTRSPLFITLVSQIGIPLGICTYWQAAGQLDASRIWLAIVCGHVTRCLLTVARFQQGKWKGIAVHVADAPAKVPIPVAAESLPVSAANPENPS
jgi:Na+-driven multidrug efflux pump